MLGLKLFRSLVAGLLFSFSCMTGSHTPISNHSRFVSLDFFRLSDCWSFPLIFIEGSAFSKYRLVPSLNLGVVKLLKVLGLKLFRSLVARLLFSFSYMTGSHTPISNHSGFVSLDFFRLSDCWSFPSIFIEGSAFSKGRLASSLSFPLKSPDCRLSPSLTVIACLLSISLQ